MAISGQIQDTGIPELIQFAGRMARPIKLIINSGHQKAEILCGQGKLWDVRCGQLKGQQALTEVLSWQDGQFEWHCLEAGALREIQTRPLDIEYALLASLKELDERKRHPGVLNPAVMAIQRIRAAWLKHCRLISLVVAGDIQRFLWIYGEPESSATGKKILEALGRFLASEPVHRAVLELENDRIALSHLSGSTYLVVVSSKALPAGVLTLLLERLSADKRLRDASNHDQLNMPTGHDVSEEHRSSYLISLDNSPLVTGEGSPSVPLTMEPGQ